MPVRRCGLIHVALLDERPVPLDDLSQTEQLIESGHELRLGALADTSEAVATRALS